MIMAAVRPLLLMASATRRPSDARPEHAITAGRPGPIP